MPIECNFFSGRSENVHRQTPIEAGSCRGFRDYSDFGRIIVAACHEEDLGGRVYIVDESLSVNGGVPGTVLDNHEFEAIPPGSHFDVAIRSEAGDDGMLIFWHLPPN